MILQYTEYFVRSMLSRFPLHFMLYRGNLDYFLDSVKVMVKPEWNRAEP